MTDAIGFRNGDLIAKNISFDYTTDPQPAQPGIITEDGQLLIGSIQTNPNVAMSAGRIDSVTTALTIDYVFPDITLDVVEGDLDISTLNATPQFQDDGVGGLVLDFGLENLFLGSQPSPFIGGSNIGYGQFQLENIGLTADFNICIGDGALFSSNVSFNNTAIGSLSLSTVVNGHSNVAIGPSALQNLVSGDENIAIGDNAGLNYTGAETNNILLSNAGTLGESNAIHIGTQGSHSSAFIAGVYGVSVPTSLQVTIDANGQLGTTSGDASSWVEVTGTSQAASVGFGYIANNVGLVTITLPANFNVGDTVRIAGLGAGLWRLAANTGDIINYGSSPTSAGGSLTATNRYDTVEVLGVATNSTWVVLSSIGNLTVA